MDKYEKLYNEALERAKAYHRNELAGSKKEMMEYIFPELRKSEDERIRKDIIKTISWIVPDCQYAIVLPREQKDEWLAWLEKQKERNEDVPLQPIIYTEQGEVLAEQKPAEGKEYFSPECGTTAWSEDEMKVLDSIIDDYEKVAKSFCGYDGKIGLLKAIRDGEYNLSKPAWSEEDTEMYINVASSLRGYACGLENEEHKGHIKKGLDWLENRFKSLRPQPREEIYQSAKHDLAIKFMNYLDENRPEGKMSLSNGECEDIDKAFKENDWAKIMRYVEKYSPQLKQDWSEEDSKRYISIGTTLETSAVLSKEDYDANMAWLRELVSAKKSLRPPLKPSEEQMEALQRAIDACESEWAYQDDELRSLLNDLKKL